jgi:ABC-type polysaccharide/polyol phosphate transport system ATPase subunit
VGQPAIAVEHVSKAFKIYDQKLQSAKERLIRAGRNPHHDFMALDDVSFEVQEGETFALLGHNGSGKSTLLKCIAGTLRPTMGSIRMRGRVAALLELGAGFHPELTGRENIYLNGSILGLSKGQVDKVFEEVVEFAEIGGSATEESFVDTQVKHYSSGMAARLGFAVAVNVEPDILLVDEVLSVGDESFQRKCIERIRKFQGEGRTILVVSHVADLVRQMAARAAVLDHGKLLTVDTPGPAIKVFRESLANRGIDPDEVDPAVEEAAEAAAAEGGVVMRDLNKQVEFGKVWLEYPRDEPYLEPGEPLAVHVGYRAATRVDDVVFALEIYDQEGYRLVGLNTDVTEQPIDSVEGEGEVVFRFTEIPLLDGHYTVNLGIHTLDGGTEYDHLEGEHAFAVLNPTRVQGKVNFPVKIEQVLKS